MYSAGNTKDNLNLIATSKCTSRGLQSWKRDHESPNKLGLKGFEAILHAHSREEQTGIANPKKPAFQRIQASTNSSPDPEESWCRIVFEQNHPRHPPRSWNQVWDSPWHSQPSYRSTASHQVRERQFKEFADWCFSFIALQTKAPKAYRMQSKIKDLPLQVPP